MEGIEEISAVNTATNNTTTNNNNNNNDNNNVKISDFSVYVNQNNVVIHPPLRQRSQHGSRFNQPIYYLGPLTLCNEEPCADYRVEKNKPVKMRIIADHYMGEWLEFIKNYPVHVPHQKFVADKPLEVELARLNFIPSQQYISYQLNQRVIKCFKEKRGPHYDAAEAKLYFQYLWDSFFAILRRDDFKKRKKKYYSEAILPDNRKKRPPPDEKDSPY